MTKHQQKYISIAVSDFSEMPNLEIDPIAEQRFELLDIQSRLNKPEFNSLIQKTDEFISGNPYLEKFMSSVVEVKPMVAVTWHSTNTSCPFEIYSIRYFGLNYDADGRRGAKQYDVEVASALAGLVMPITSNVIPTESEIELVSRQVENLKAAKEYGQLPNLDRTLSHIRVPQTVS